MSSQEEAEKAVRTLIEWAGEPAMREGLLNTPKRVAEAYGEFFSGYSEDPKVILEDGFSQVGGYEDLVLVQKVPFYSHCEHHMIPFFGHADIAYVPDTRVVGFSRLVRVLEVFSRRLQIQERLTQQIADVIQEALMPKGVAVMLSAEHLCMSMRGIRRPGVQIKTHAFCGTLSEPQEQERFFRMLD
jgi:GTP cyclohydrolase I